MSVQRIAGRYAKSLLEMAQEQNKLERVLEDVNDFGVRIEARLDSRTSPITFILNLAQFSFANTGSGRSVRNLLVKYIFTEEQ